MKNIALLLLLFSFGFLHAQYSKGTVYYLDGNSKKGHIKVANNFKVKFKSNSDTKPISYNYEEISGIDFEDGAKYRFKKYQKGFSPMLFELLKSGKMNLYLNEAYNPGIMQPNGMFFGGGNSRVYYIETFGKFVKIGSRIKTKDFYRFSACPGLVKKIKSKEFKRSDLYGIVSYYNLHYNDAK